MSAITTIEEGDLTPIVDISDIVQSSTGITKKSTITQLADFLKARAETLTNKTLTSPVLNTGVSGTAVLDEDDMASDSATKLATQQSIKAYADAMQFTFRGSWVTSTAYSVKDIVEYNGSGYVCETSHTSAIFSTDLSSGKWSLLVEGFDGVIDTKFRVYRNAAANTGNAEFALVSFDTELFDTGSNFASGVFTAPVSGYYQFNWGVQMTCDGTSRSGISSLFIDGVERSRGGRMQIPASGIYGSTGSDVVYMAADSVADIRAFGSVALALGVGSTHLTYFSGVLISL